MKRLRFEVRWWSHWWAREFPHLLRTRLTTCRTGHGARYDGGGPCLGCASPWFLGAWR